jgi:GT2 family glycosyltransferase/glycosyltransferase involved in cell wall biosynthesis
MLRSLLATLPRGLAHEIILVDDASGDGTPGWLRTLDAVPAIRQIRNERNLGYAAANNRAAATARGRILCLLNNDLVLLSGWLEPMLRALTRVRRAGMVGNIQLNHATGEVDHGGVVFEHDGYPFHYRGRLTELQATRVREFPAVTAACCLTRRDWFLAVGGFDPAYRNGFEDIDLCLRARQDGLVNLVANRSVVRHRIASSPGRQDHERENARLFLDRWRATTRKLEREGIATPTPHGRGQVARLRQRLLGSEWAPPVRVAVDLMRMEPGGGHGGIKPFVYEFIGHLQRHSRHNFDFYFIAGPGLRAEIEPRLRRRDRWIGPVEAPALADLDVDVLYAPFGYSELAPAGLPVVSVVVDLLHRDLPETLPPAEVSYREECFQRMVGQSLFFQCDSRHVMTRLAGAYSVPPHRMFHTYIAIQGRAVPAGGADPRPPGSYFLYPSNFWPHKNHEILLLAYRAYRERVGDGAWSLVCTGFPDERMEKLRRLAATLGVDPWVDFPGYLGEAALARVRSQAGALVFPSLHEGFGIPLLEAMNDGIPVLCSDATALPEIGGDACLYFDARKPVDLAECLRRVSSDPQLRIGLVEKGRLRAALFSLDREAGKLAHYLREAARQNDSRRPLRRLWPLRRRAGFP